MKATDCFKLLAAFLAIGSCATASRALAETNSPTTRPTLYLIGDSTVKNGTRGLMGWGEVIAKHFDANRIVVANHAIGGRSSRTFFTEGRWEKVRRELKPRDFVIMQIGHNDGGGIKANK